MRLDRLAPLDVQAIASKMTAEGYSSRTVRIAFAALRRALNQAVRWRLIARSPAEDVELPKKASREMPALTAAQEFFIYNSGNPVMLSAAELRGALQKAVHDLDPDGKDPALRQMVIVGHSQGGLLTKAMVALSGDAFWNEWSSEKFEDVKFTPETRALLKSEMFFEPLPFVTRVIFIATPHRGSFLAENWLGMLGRKLVNAPSYLARSSLEMATLSKDPRVFRRPFQLPTSIDNMDWSNPGLRTLASLPIAPGVHASSIIPVKSAPIETGDDGVVKYESAHIEPVESELVVLGSGHST